MKIGVQRKDFITSMAWIPLRDFVVVLHHVCREKRTMLMDVRTAERYVRHDCLMMTENEGYEQVSLVQFS